LTLGYGQKVQLRTLRSKARSAGSYAINHTPCFGKAPTDAGEQITAGNRHAHHFDIFANSHGSGQVGKICKSYDFTRHCSRQQDRPVNVAPEGSAKTDVQCIVDVRNLCQAGHGAKAGSIQGDGVPVQLGCCRGVSDVGPEIQVRGAGGKSVGQPDQIGSADEDIQRSPASQRG
tara:strand:- start:2360 stop:2881 length:522 start_codon:yes stop_codon:yes gene_type:complete